MIILFRDNSVNYWLNNSIVDCGKTESTNNNLDIEFTEDILSDDLEILIESEQKKDIMNNKKLNKKDKHTHDHKFNEPKCQKDYIGRNRKIINGSPTKTDSQHKSFGPKYKYKDSDYRINDTKASFEHKYLYQYPNTNYNHRKVREMSKSSGIYYRE
jgi:hypothetical protein